MKSVEFFLIKKNFEKHDQTLSSYYAIGKRVGEMTSHMKT
jgi:hypothetical protein